MLFSLEKIRVKPGTVLIETVLSADYLYINNRSDAQRLYISAKKPFSNFFFANGVVTFVVVMKFEWKLMCF